MTLELEPANAGDARYLVLGIQEVSERSRDDTYTERLVDALEEGLAEAWLGLVDGAVCGGLVLQKVERSLLVRAAWIDPPFRHDRGLLAAGIAWLESLAERRGLDAVVFMSSRPGWSRVAPQFGWGKLNETFGRRVA